MEEKRRCPFRKYKTHIGAAFEVCYGKGCMAYQTFEGVRWDDETIANEAGRWCKLIDRVNAPWIGCEKGFVDE
jgi:hypothetical protein